MSSHKPGKCKTCGGATSNKRAPECATCYRGRGERQAPKKSQYVGTVCGHPTSRRGNARCRTCHDADRNGTGLGVLPAQPEQHPADFARDHLVERLKNDAGLYRKAYVETVKDRAAEERLIGLFSTAITRFPVLPPTAFKTPTQPRHKAPAVETPVLLMGDQHIGEEVRLEETNGINRYNFSVFQARLEHLENRVVDILTDHQRAPFEELVVFSLGDNVSGVIHDELQKYGHQHIIDQVYLGALCSALFLYRLLMRLRARGVKKIRVSCVSGNHGRTSQDKESKRYYKNFDYLTHSLMAQALMDVPAIEFHIPRCLFTVVDVAKHRILQSHGHELPPSSLGIPLYSINRASAGYQELMSWSDSSRFDYWVMGHFHRPMELDNAIVNGTMAGLTEFGLGRFKPVRPAQKLMGFTEKWGKSWEYPIRLDKAPDDAKVYTFGMDMPTHEALELFGRERGKISA